MPKVDKIVGIGGYSRSGKDTLANMLIGQGYFGISVGDIAREYTQERHKDEANPISRINLTETSNWLREKHGPDVYMKIALDKFKNLSSNKKYLGLLVWSIRAPIEADFILKQKGTLIWINSDPETRYQRAMEHLRQGEPRLSFKDYMAQEETQVRPQLGIEESIQMNMDYVKSVANLRLENNFIGTDKFLDFAKDKLKNL